MGPRIVSTRVHTVADGPAASSEASVNPVGEPRAGDGSASAAQWDGNDRDFWVGMMDCINKPSALGMIARLDTNDPLGVDTSMKGVSTAKGSLYQFTRDIRERQGRRKMVLVRVGEFFEAWGFDALLLVQFCGLNPMGNGVPRAGFPVANLRRALRDLVIENGLSVVVCEEVNDLGRFGRGPSHLSRKRKDRFIAQIVTPAFPDYIYRTVAEDISPELHGDDSGSGGSAQCMRTNNIVALAFSARGLIMMSVDLALRRCVVEDSLTEDSVAQRLQAGGFVLPIYLHAKAAHLKETLKLDAIVETIGPGGVGTGGNVVTYGGDPQGQLFKLLNIDLNLPASSPFQIADRGDSNGKPRPLSLSTVRQLGLVAHTGGVPSLTEVLLAPGAPSACRRYVDSLLRSPPRPAVARQINEAARALSHGSMRHEAVPDFCTRAPSRFVSLLNSCEANHVVFRELHQMLAAVLSFLSQSAAAGSPSLLLGVARLLMLPAAEETGITDIDIQTLRSESADAMRDIEKVVSFGDDAAAPTALAVRAGGVPNREGDASTSSAAPDDSIGSPILYFESELERLVEVTEAGLRGRVLSSVISEELRRLDDARCEYVRALELHLKPFLRTTDAATGARLNKTERHSIKYDHRNNTLWLKGGPKAAKLTDSAASSEVRFVHPLDRFGKPQADCYSTTLVESTHREYMEAASEADEAIMRHLKGLSLTLANKTRSIVFGSTLSIIAKSVLLHMQEGARRGWSFPSIGAVEDARQEGRELIVNGMFPYWLPKLSPQTQTNNIKFGGEMILLTGPNMAGKSTVCRSTCSLALLANCGLMVPASDATVPFYDAFIIKMGSSDSPEEGLSSFAVEMLDAKTALSVTERSLVFLDELGRGTDVFAGSALAGAILERFDAVGCSGIFSTHLHPVLDLPLRTERVRRCQMEIESAIDQDGNAIRRPTMRMIDGESRESLAFETARRYQIDEEVVKRAEALLQFVSFDGGRPSHLVQSCVHEYGPGVGEPGLGNRNGSHHVAARSPPSCPPSSCSLFDLAEASEVLLEVAKTIGTALHSDSEYLHLRVGRVGRHELPPPATSGVSCVYVTRDPAGSFYCGESDDLHGRIADHRRGPTSKRKEEFAYVMVIGGKSLARHIETRTIEALLRRGFPVRPVRGDANHRNFGLKF